MIGSGFSYKTASPVSPIFRPWPLSTRLLLKPLPWPCRGWHER